MTTQKICICVFSKCYFSYLHLRCMIRQNGRGSWKKEGTTYERKRLATPSSTKAWLIINRQCRTHCLISLQIYLQAKLPKTNYFYIYHNIKAWLFTSSARRKAYDSVTKMVEQTDVWVNVLSPLFPLFNFYHAKRLVFVLGFTWHENLARAHRSRTYED